MQPLCRRQGGIYAKEHPNLTKHPTFINLHPARRGRILRDDTYHRCFDNAVREKLRAFGKCLIIDGHSFYDELLPYESDQDRKRPDICIGTDTYHTPEKTERLLYRYFEDCGYSVAINKPFAGCIVPSSFYQKERRVMSVMIEINRRLYIDHDIRKTPGYHKIKTDIATAVKLLEERI